MEDDLDNYLNFYSVSGDGRLTNWCLVKSKIRYSDKYLINYSKPLTNISKENFASQLLGELIVSLLPATPTKLVSRHPQRNVTQMCITPTNRCTTPMHRISICISPKLGLYNVHLPY